jgi:hypothetical protein
VLSLLKGYRAILRRLRAERKAGELLATREKANR